MLGRAAIEPPALPLPVAAVRVLLGFPSPAEDFQDGSLDLNNLLVRNPPATFFYRAQGWSMVQAGICSGDVLVVDRSVQPRDGDLVIAQWDGNAPSCKLLRIGKDHLELHSCNDQVAPIVLGPDVQVEVFAVVGVVRQIQRGQSRFSRPSLG